MSLRSLRRIILFTRYPEPGTTKTRMIPGLGPEGAAMLQRQMTEHIISKISQFAGSQPIAVQVRFEGGNKKLMQAWLGAKFEYCRQGIGDIGLRMATALGEGFEDGCQAVVIIGSDIPGITSDIIAKGL